MRAEDPAGLIGAWQWIVRHRCLAAIALTVDRKPDSASARGSAWETKRYAMIIQLNQSVSAFATPADIAYSAANASNAP